jgi:hypothetical protein
MALTACAGSQTSPTRPTKTLDTGRSASRFVSDIARGGKIASWRLAADASPRAREAWATRHVAQDFGNRVRHEGNWACMFADKATEVREYGHFTLPDQESAVQVGKAEGGGESAIASLLHDAAGLAEADLMTATRALCR